MSRFEKQHPTGWINEYADQHGWQYTGAWDGCDYRGEMRGAFGSVPWRCTFHQCTDLDAPVIGHVVWTANLRPPDPTVLLTVSASTGGGATSGTELDLAIAAIGAARDWLRRRKREVTDQGEPAPVPQSLRIDDPSGILTDDLRDDLALWPKLRSLEHACTLDLRYVHGRDLALSTWGWWGSPERLHHQLSIAERLVARLP